MNETRRFYTAAKGALIHVKKLQVDTTKQTYIEDKVDTSQVAQSNIFEKEHRLVYMEKQVNPEYIFPEFIKNIVSKYLP